MTRRRSRIVRYPGDVFLRLAIRRHIENGEVMQRMWPWPRCEDHDVKIVWCDIILKSRDVKIMYHNVNLRTLMASKLCDMELCTFLWCQSLWCGIILSTCDVRTIKQDVILRTFVTSTLCEWCHFEDSWCRKFVKLYHCYLWAVKTMIASIRGLVTSKLCVLTPYRVLLMSKLCDLTLSWELPTSKLCIRCFPLVLWLGFGQQQTLNYNIQQE